MRTIIGGVFAVLLCYGFMLNPTINKKNWRLEELINHKDIEVKIKSNGRHSGESVELEFNSNFNYPITIKVTEGTLFFPKNEKEQTLVVPQQELITLLPTNRTTNKKVRINAYCTEARESCPTSGGDFTIGVNTDKKLSKFFTYLKTNKVEEENMQESIWCITDNHSIGYIYVEDKKSTLKQVISKITGQKIPWQSTKRKLVVNEERRIVPVPLLVKGDITFETKEKTEIKSKIIKYSNSNLSLSDLINGAYFLVISNTTLGTYMTKIIKLDNELLLSD